MLPRRFDLKYLANYTKGLFTNNKTYKIIALLIAIFAWVWVAKGINSKVTLTVPLQITIPNETEYIIVGDIEKQVTLTVWGPVDMVRSLGPLQVKAYLDIKNPEKGESTFVLNKRNVSFLTSKMVLLDIEPGEIKLNFQKLKR